MPIPIGHLPIETWKRDLTEDLIFVTAFANSGVIITASLMIILGADVLMAGRSALNLERAGNDV
jgi:hypothetical protein